MESHCYFGNATLAIACAAKGSLPDGTDPQSRYIYVVDLNGGRDVKAEVWHCGDTTGGTPTMTSTTVPAALGTWTSYSGNTDCYNQSMIDPASSPLGLKSSMTATACN